MVQKARIGKTQVETLQQNETVWDTRVTGFGARRQRSAAVTFFLMYRAPDGVQRRLTIGRYGPLTPDQARDRAKTYLGQVACGQDPSASRAAEKAAADVGELCDQYLRDAQAGRLLTRRRTAKKASTIATDIGRVERHVKPLLGTKKVAALTAQDVEGFLHDVAEGRTAMRAKSGKARGVTHVRGGRGTATRTLALLSTILSYGVRRGLLPANPAFGVVPFAYNARERRLADAEYPKLMAGITDPNLWPAAADAARVLLISGWRRGEVIGLRWPEVDLERQAAVLADTKTGKSVRPLCQAVCEIIERQPRGGEFVFAAARGTGTMSGFPSYWRKILAAGALPSDITAHTLRHSFASVAAELGFTESTIAALLGHARHTTTSKYVHLRVDGVLLAAADAVAERIQQLCFAGR